MAEAVIKATSSRWEEILSTARHYLSSFVPQITVGDPQNAVSLSLSLRPSRKNADAILDMAEQIAQDKKISLVICIDEFQQISGFEDPDAFQSKLRSHWQLHQHVAYCLYGSRRHMMTEIFTNPGKAFYKFGQNIFKDYYKEVSTTLNQKMSEEGFFDNYTTRLRELRKAAEEHMMEIGESFFDTLESEGIAIDDLSNKQRGIASFFNKIRRGDFDPGIVNTTVTNHLVNPEKWCAKTHPKREQIIQLAETTLGDILRYAVDAREQQWKIYQSANLTLRHLNQLRLLSSIEQKVRELNETDNRFLLSDTQQLLHSLIDGSDSPFIFEKIGTQLEHVMIDEFQDTSTIQ